MPLLINDLLSKAEGKQRLILLELKKLNKEAYQKYFLIPYVRSFKAKYHLLQKSIVWKRAKELLIEYFLGDRKSLRCKRCGNLLTRNDITMHHLKNDMLECFTPLHIEFVHHTCHAKIHGKKT